MTILFWLLLLVLIVLILKREHRREGLCDRSKIKLTYEKVKQLWTENNEEKIKKYFNDSVETDLIDCL